MLAMLAAASGASVGLLLLRRFVLGQPGLGFLLGFASLEVMRQLVTKAAGKTIGWLFALGVLLPAAFGIYLGRFVRLSSWEPLTSPVDSAGEIVQAMGRVVGDIHALAFVTICAGFLILGHGLLHSISLFHFHFISNQQRS